MLNICLTLLVWVEIDQSVNVSLFTDSGLERKYIDVKILVTTLQEERFGLLVVY